LTFSTSSSAAMLNGTLSSILRVESVAQPVADEIEAEQRGSEEVSTMA